MLRIRSLDSSRLPDRGIAGENWRLLDGVLRAQTYLGHSLNSLKGDYRGLYRELLWGIFKGILGV